MVKDAYRFVIPLLVLGVLFVLLHLSLIAVVPFALALFTAFFFRNPSRAIPPGDNIIVSPADGRVVKIAQDDNRGHCVSIFLSVFNVHVNRSPISGCLKGLEYRRGRFRAAFHDEASAVNEQNILRIEGKDVQVTFKQIAGLIARRVVCWKKPGDFLDKGELVGLIRFGSRVDVLLPENVNIRVQVGDRVRGGSSIIGDY